MAGKFDIVFWTEMCHRKTSKARSMYSRNFSSFHLNQNFIVLTRDKVWEWMGGVYYWNCLTCVYVCCLEKILFVLFNFFQPCLVWQCIIVNQNVMWKDWVAVFKVKVTVISEGFTLQHNIKFVPYLLKCCNQMVCWYIIVSRTRASTENFGLPFSRPRSQW